MTCFFRIMYIEIQRKINRYMIFIFIIISFIIAFLVGLFHSYHYSKSILIFLIFLLFILMNLLIRFMERNLEHHYQYKMLQRQQVALARINRAHFYKEIRDSNFKAQKSMKTSIAMTFMLYLVILMSHIKKTHLISALFPPCF